MHAATQNSALKTQHLLPLLLVFAVLIAAYAPTFQTIPNGSSDDYMVDVGETQIALNAWGTLHPTGYPLYTLTASLLTHGLTALGVNPALAPGLASLAFGWIALAILYALLLRLTGRAWPSAAAALLLGLTRSWWIHSVIAETYTFSMMLLAALLALALSFADWPVRRRVWALAFVGGVAVFHHRVLILAALALLMAVWPELWRKDERHCLPGTLLGALILGLLGGVQYLYLPLRDWAGGDWVYGAPGTWQGFREVFTGYEYGYLLGPAAGWGDLADHLGRAADILAAELTLPGLIASVGLLILPLVLTRKSVTADSVRRYGPRRLAVILLALAIPFVLWVVVMYRSVLPQAVLMPVVAVLVIGAALGANAVLDRFVAGAQHGVSLPVGIVFICVALVVVLIAQNRPFIRDLTQDDSGLKMIALAERLPRDENPAFVVPWGPRHFPIAFGQRFLGRNTDLLLVDHRADFRALYEAGHAVVTQPDTFYVFIPDWWAERYGGERVYVYGFAPGVVEVRPAPVIVEHPLPPLADVTDGITLQSAELSCDADTITLDLTWAARETPARDLSVFVHLTGPDRADVLAQADSSHPAAGFHATSSWLPGEQVRDVYGLPRLDGAQMVVFGMYTQDGTGAFVNYGETTLLLAEGAGCE
jgi:hypothetical protein